jgi:hypothetical protein
MIDDKEIRDIEEKMQECIKTMRTMAPLVGQARQIKEFSPDQRKNALAAEQIKYITRGESVAASEIHKAGQRGAEPAIDRRLKPTLAPADDLRRQPLRDRLLEAAPEG